MRKTYKTKINNKYKKILRPWGSYTVLIKGKGFKVKLVEVLSAKRLSLQKHKYRSEHWVVVNGKAKITNCTKEYLLKNNQSAYIAKGELHRLENCGKNRLKIIEVQCGRYLGEDDIIRIKDDFGRIQ